VPEPWLGPAAKDPFFFFFFFMGAPHSAHNPASMSDDRRDSRSVKGRGASGAGDDSDRYKGKSGIFDRLDDGEPGPIACSFHSHYNQTIKARYFQDFFLCAHKHRIAVSLVGSLDDVVRARLAMDPS
jgi:hypothetical protein